MDSLTERLAEALRYASDYVSSAASWQKSHNTFGCSDTEIQAKNIEALLAEFNAAKAAQEAVATLRPITDEDVKHAVEVRSEALSMNPLAIPAMRAALESVFPNGVPYNPQGNAPHERD